MDYRKWEKTNLLNLSSNGLMNGAFNNPKLVGSGYKLINVVNLYSEPCIKTAELELLNLPNSEYEKYKAKKYDVFFTRSSLKLEGIAHCNIFLEDREDVIFECHIIRVRPDKNKIDPRYLHYYCISADARRHFMKCAKTTTMTTIDQEGIGSLSVLIPSLPEQQKIAEVLGTWDEAIDLLEKLITAKRKLKQGLMQQLLTGKKRFKDFEDCGWELQVLGNFGTNNYPVVKAGPFGSSLKKEFYTTQGYKIYGQEQVIANNPFMGNYYINEEKFNQLKSCEVLAGDILVSLVGTIGRVLLVPSEAERGVINPRLLRIRTDKQKVVPMFLKYFLESEANIKIMSELSQGGTMGVLNAKSFKSLSFPLLSITEQEKIVYIFSCIDKEILLLDKQLAVHKQQKRGLMQQLLTGKKRLN